MCNSAPIGASGVKIGARSERANLDVEIIRHCRLG